MQGISKSVPTTPTNQPTGAQMPSHPQRVTNGQPGLTAEKIARLQRIFRNAARGIEEASNEQ